MAIELPKLMQTIRLSSIRKLNTKKRLLFEDLSDPLANGESRRTESSLVFGVYRYESESSVIAPIFADQKAGWP